jgi:3-hydroxyacyl-[acyl-carrier-protein] dehydratase
MVSKMAKDIINNYDYLLQIQNNRYPYLFIDKILSIEPGRRVSTQKSFTYNEWFFPIHFENDPIVPGFIIMELLIQSFILTFLSLEEYIGAITADYNIKEFIIRRSIVPGDTLVIVSDLVKINRGIAEGFAIGLLDGEEVCKIELAVVIPKILEKYKVELL